jgi:hypothetical protein
MNNENKSPKFVSGLPLKHAKIVLSKLEQANSLTPELRKLILDAANECQRDILKYLS